MAIVLVNVYLILQIPDSISVCKLLKRRTTLGQNTTFKSTHVEKKIWIIFAVDRHKTFIPSECGDRSWQTVLDVPEHSTPKINIMFHKSHASISGPAFSVIVAHNVLIVRIRVFCKVSLNKITSFISWKSKDTKKASENHRILYSASSHKNKLLI